MLLLELWQVTEGSIMTENKFNGMDLSRDNGTVVFTQTKRTKRHG